MELPPDGLDLGAEAAARDGEPPPRLALGAEDPPREGVLPRDWPQASLVPEAARRQSIVKVDVSALRESMTVNLRPEIEWHQEE